MRKLTTLYGVTCALLFAAWQCLAQLPLTHGGKGAASQQGSAALTFQGATVETFGNSPNTFTSIPIGTAFSTREVVVFLVLNGSYNGAVTAVTIGGVTASIQAYVGSGAAVPNFSSQILWAWANVPTGTSASVVVTGGASVGDGNGSLLAYTFDNSLTINGSPTTAVNNVATATAASNTITLNTGAGGFIIAGLRVEDLVASSAYAITASTETYANDATDSSVHYAAWSKKSGSSSNTPTSVTFGWTGGSLQSLASLLAWN